MSKLAMSLALALVLALRASAMRDQIAIENGPSKNELYGPWHEHEHCTMACGKSIDYGEGHFFSAAEGKCLKWDSQDECPGEKGVDYDKFFAKDLDDRQKRRCVYKCTRVTLPKKSMCCGRNQVYGWVTPDNLFESRKSHCPLGFDESAAPKTDCKTTQYSPVVASTFSLNGAINKPFHGYQKHAKCGMKCGKSIHYTSSFFSLNSDKCITRAETCDEDADKFWGKNLDEERLRRCVYPCTERDIPEGSMCCGHKWVLREKLREDEATGSRFCPDGNPTIGDCDGDSDMME